MYLLCQVAASGSNFLLKFSSPDIAIFENEVKREMWGLHVCSSGEITAASSRHDEVLAADQ